MCWQKEGKVFISKHITGVLVKLREPHQFLSAWHSPRGFQTAEKEIIVEKLSLGGTFGVISASPSAEAEVKQKIFPATNICKTN